MLIRIARLQIDDSRLHIYGAQEASSKYYSFPRFDANETWQSAVERVGQWKAETNDAASKQFEEAVMGSPASFIPTHGEKGWTEKREIGKLVHRISTYWQPVAMLINFPVFWIHRQICRCEPKSYRASFLQLDTTRIVELRRPWQHPWPRTVSLRVST